MWLKISHEETVKLESASWPLYILWIEAKKTDNDVAVDEDDKKWMNIYIKLKLPTAGSHSGSSLQSLWETFRPIAYRKKINTMLFIRETYQIKHIFLYNMLKPLRTENACVLSHFFHWLFCPSFPQSHHFFLSYILICQRESKLLFPQISSPTCPCWDNNVAELWGPHLSYS